MIPQILIVAAALLAVGWLVSLIIGKIHPSVVFASSICGLGLVSIIAVFILPRQAFGESGSGDGFGLIGLMILGAGVLVTGIIALAITAAVGTIGNRRQRQAEEQHFSKVDS